MIKKDFSPESILSEVKGLEMTIKPEFWE